MCISVYFVLYASICIIEIEIVVTAIYSIYACRYEAYLLLADIFHYY